MRCFRLVAMGVLLAAISSGWCASSEGANRNEPTIRLLDAVEVRGNRVWLSDLLPIDAPAAIRKTSATIELCQAPEPGSTRILDAALIAGKLVGQSDILRQLSIPPRITVRNSGWPIAASTVRIAISQFLHEQRWVRDLPDGARIESLQPSSATEETPALRVMSLDWDSRQQSVQVRLRCSVRASCSSFLVHLVLPAPLSEEWHTQLRLGSDLNSQPNGRAADNRSGAVLAEKGKLATLVLENGGMRISVRVICLQPGVLNQQIRVFDAKSRHVFHAEVVGANLLHATL
jgi:hypothetical protein